MTKNNYYSLARREDVNIAVRYILAINDIVDECSETKNIADIISEMIEEKRLKFFNKSFANTKKSRFLYREN